MKIIFLFFVFCSVCSAKIINLGTYGNAKQINLFAIRQANEQYLQKKFSGINQKAYFDNIPAPKIYFHTNIPLAQMFYSFSKKLNIKMPYPNTTMVFFGINKASKQFLQENKNIKFNYGYCIDFNSLKDIEKFKKEMDITYPVGIVNNDKTLKELGITSYPAIIIVKNNIETIEEGAK